MCANFPLPALWTPRQIVPHLFKQHLEFKWCSIGLKIKDLCKPQNTICREAKGETTCTA